jgi:hypothetical protein
MKRLTIRSQVGADGILRVNVPIGTAEARSEVQVTIELIGVPTTTQKDWQDFIESTAGSITDPTFVRHEQGDTE